MPGPGGGGGHGGGGGGHGGGGGFGGGGMHHYGGFGGGCLGRRGGCISGIVTIVALVVFLIIFLVSYLGNCTGINGCEWREAMSESDMQNYISPLYDNYFDKSSPTYEDNITIVIAVSEENSEYYYYCWVGDNIKVDITQEFGSNIGDVNNGGFGEKFDSYMEGDNITSRIPRAVSDSIDYMSTYIQGLQLESNYKHQIEGEHKSAKIDSTASSCVEVTSLMTISVEEFTTNTGIPLYVRICNVNEIME